ncbi:MAG: calcium-binding protein, partial [Alphaproteobacteria bacterium]|nr:calcium-binding protein [Alphaproteobacteria bacterium]
MTAGAGANKMYGGTGNDTIVAGSGSDTVHGGNGNDTITGGNGKDKLYGDDGNDVINGGGKSDTIYGGGGNDTLTGSSGADTFVFTQRAGDDVITDFTNGSDKIDLSGFGVAYSAISAATSAVTGGVLIDLDLVGGSGSIFLESFVLGNLDVSDFIL